MVRFVASSDVPGVIVMLGDTPESAISRDRIMRGFADVYVASPTEISDAIIMRSHFIPAELIAFGSDAGSIWAIVRSLDDWVCVNAPQRVAIELAAIMTAETGRGWDPADEIHYQLDQPVGVWPNADVRRLTIDDGAILEAATDAFGLAGWRFGSAEALLRDGFAAGAVIDGALVSIAFSTAITPRYGEVGVSTLAAFRGRSYSTVAAALVCADVQAAGLTPVWSTSETNLPSRRIAEKLGFQEISRRVYLNPA